jgi:flagellar biosynthetic protein FlhB
MAEKGYEDKTEKATPKKRQDARKKGQVAKSKELPSVAVLLASLIILSIFTSYMYTNIKTIMGKSFSISIGSDFHVQDYVAFGQDMITLFILTLGPLFAAIVIAAVLSNVGGAGYLTVKGEIKNVLFLGDMELHSIITYTLVTIFKLFITCTIAMIFLVAVDYAFQKWDFEKRLKMSKTEIKDEFKKTEGDPLVKSRVRSIQMQMARKRMMHDVPNADVIITNPTHFAVALKYDAHIMNAPKLLAKGSGGIASRIKDLAEKHDIPIIQNKELARSLYSLVEVGQEVPGGLYQSVAEVLAYIYRIKAQNTRLKAGI